MYRLILAKISPLAKKHSPTGAKSTAGSIFKRGRRNRQRSGRVKKTQRPWMHKQDMRKRWEQTRRLVFFSSSLWKITQFLILYPKMNLVHRWEVLYPLPNFWFICIELCIFSYSFAFKITHSLLKHYKTWKEFFKFASLVSRTVLRLLTPMTSSLAAGSGINTKKWSTETKWLFENVPSQSFSLILRIMIKP